MSGYLWWGGRQRGRSWRSRVCGRSASKVIHTTQCPGLMNVTLRVLCPWPKTLRWACEPVEETDKTRNKRLQVHGGHVLNSVWSSTAVGILWSYFHWNASSVLQCHLWHWISDPVGAFHPLWQFWLQWVNVYMESHQQRMNWWGSRVDIGQMTVWFNILEYQKHWHQYMFTC